MMERGEIGIGSFKTGQVSAHSPNKSEKVKEFNFNAALFISELDKHRRRSQSRKTPPTSTKSRL
jgi:hypothetical protein